MEEPRIKDLLAAIRADPLVGLAEETASRMNSPLCLVGGWIRDRLIGRSSRDYDFILQGDVPAFAERVAKRLGVPCFVMGHEVPPNYRIVGCDFTMDVVPRHPQGLDQELRRRDFTINSLAFSFDEQELLDPLGGLKDLQKRVIRSISAQALDADPLRLLRAVRFAAVLPGFALDPETVTQILKRSERISESAMERIREELDRIMLSGRARHGLSLMDELGLLQIVLPQVRRLSGLDQGPHHHLDALQHTLETVLEVDELGSLMQAFEYPFATDREDRIVLSYSALLHDIGKNDCHTVDEQGVAHFYGHEKAGADAAAQIMKHYAFPNRRCDRVKRLIQHHVIGLGLLDAECTPRTLRRIVRKLGDDLPLHVLLSLSDRRAARGVRFSHKEDRTIALGQALLDTYREQGERILHPPVLITGKDVMEALGILPGPEVGQVLKKVLDSQIEQVIQTREQALEFLRNLRPGKTS